MTLDPEPGTTVLPPSVEAVCHIGVDEMDSQHVRIFYALQRLQESLEGPFPLETLGARLKQLETMTLEHFRDEELLMERRGYPHLLPHRAEHEVLIERCHTLLSDYSSPESPPLVHLPGQLQAVFISHIQGVDMDYARYLAGHP
jgi:hemerythrin-like metal-binding protein